jgi:glycosyltransferase involved in cell wall biosynthesis
MPNGRTAPAALPRKPAIALLTGSSLCHNPRALKAAATLARAGYRVRVLGAWLDPSFKTRDLRLMSDLPFEFVPVLDATRAGPRAEMARLAHRMTGKLARLAHRVGGWSSPALLGHTARNMLRQALASQADLYIAHSEPGLYVARQLLRRNRRVGVDMEDWFSQDLLPEARRDRPVRLLQLLERELLAAAACSFCPSQAMAAALAEAYCCRPPTAVYNAFAWSDRQKLDASVEDRRDPGIASVYWFSTTIGRGRGLEDLLAALPLVKCDMEVHLRGNCASGFAEWARGKIPERWRDKVFFHGLIDNHDLLPRIAEHDIGFAGEQTYCRSRDLTVTNKILHYLLGGVAVIAGDTAGQREVARAAPGAIITYQPGDAPALAGALNALLGSPQRLQRAKAAALAAAEKTFCWERQEGSLLEAAAQATGAAIAGDLNRQAAVCAHG